MNLYESISILYTLSLDVDKFRQFMSTKNDNSLKTIKIESIEKIFLEHITFSYQQTVIFSDLSLTIENCGYPICIVGANGVGKSTLINILLGNLIIEKGKFLINNIDKSIIDFDSYINKISCLFQDSKIFSFSIAQNILLKYDITKDDEEIVINVLKEIGLYDKIKRLPQGIHTSISKEFSNNGIMLSGGELKKISLARVLATNSNLVLLDEPFSSCDIQSKKEILQIILQIAKKKMTILITHEIELLPQLQDIVLIKDGTFCERGTYEELMNKKASFYNMIQKLQKE